jgi:transposase
MVDDTFRLPGLDGLAVVGVEDGPDGPIVQVVTADRNARNCPERGNRARRSKGRRMTRPRDLPVGGRRPQLVWTKRRCRYATSSSADAGRSPRRYRRCRRGAG